jgi:hypothetical protein
MTDTTLTAPPRIGDFIYLPTAAYISHGRDDFRGGRCTVSAVEPGISGGAIAVFFSVRERPGHQYNWTYLAPEQDRLRAQWGDSPGGPDPDYRDEFNEPYG